MCDTTNRMFTGLYGNVTSGYTCVWETDNLMEITEHIMITHIMQTLCTIHLDLSSGGPAVRHYLRVSSCAAV